MSIDALPTQEPPSSVYVPKDIKPKRDRRTKVKVAAIRKAIVDILSDDHPQTVRQVFYALTVRGVIAKAEIEYKRTVIRLLVEMREAGTIPFDWLADNTRWQRKPTTFTGIEACLNSTSKFYRRDLWAAMPVYVEVWCEKDALAGVLMEETEVFDVPLMVAKGYASLSFLHSAAMAIKGKGKPAFIYHFGDLDPSGVDAARDIEAKLRRYAPEAEIHFERPAVTRAQVDEWNLPTRPTKTTDTRAKKFNNATSVELDAIPARKLRDLVRERIEQHVDHRQLEILRAAEASERDLLKAWAVTYGGRPCSS
jgi:AcrR family transcriptional regulator